jgi:uncharacterized protein
MNELFDRGIAEYNRGEYFEAHDTWEELWRETRGDERLFYQALIQAAVGLYHLSRGNLPGAKSQLKKAVAKLEQYPPLYHGVRTEELLRDLRVRAGMAEPGATPPCIQRV